MVRTVAQIEAEERASSGLSYAPRPRRVGIVADFLEERWPSMDLAAELTSLALARYSDGVFQPAILRPRLRRVLRGRFGLPGNGAANADRFLGRYVAYPRWLRGRRSGFDLFHVIDHSYAHLVHTLAGRATVVTCHDLDAFRSVLGGEPRPLWFRATMARVLSGLRRAAHVICDSQAVRDALEGEAKIPARCLSVVPLPVHPDFTSSADPEADAKAASLLGSSDDAIDLLHVGANVPRKNIPFLLKVFAGVRKRHPGARLLRVGGGLTDEQRAIATRLRIGDAIVDLPFLDRPTLAAVYRRAHAVLLPSEREGFGWPVLEAMACGTPVVASAALPTVREIAGDAVDFAAAGDVDAWVAAVDRVLREDARERSSRRRSALDRAEAFSLETYAAGVMAVYREVLGMRAA